MENKTIHCPFCDEEILADAKKCKHCGEWLSEEDRIAHEESAEEPKGYIIGAIISGVIAATLCTLLWVLVVGWINYEHSTYSIAVGAIIGFTVRWIGRGETLWFGIIAAVCSVIACFLGEYFSEIDIDGNSLIFYSAAAIEAYFVARNQSDDD